MLNKLINWQNSYLIEYGSVHEKGPKGFKMKKHLFHKANCNEFFDKYREIFNCISKKIEIDFSGIIEELPICKFESKTINILGEYKSDTREIKYYDQTQESLVIVKIHERFHAIHHLTEDSKGYIWNNFAEIDSFYLELLAQLFTRIYIENHKPNLLLNFLQLTARQPYIYNTHRLFEDYSQADAEKLYWIIRNNDSSNPTFKFLIIMKNALEITKLDNAVANGIRKSINRFRERPLNYFTESDIHSSLQKDIMEGNTDHLNVGEHNISLVHLEYPTNFRYIKDQLLTGYDTENFDPLKHETSITKKIGDRGNFDLSILNPEFINRLKQSPKFKSNYIEHIINKNKDNTICRMEDGEYNIRINNYPEQTFFQSEMEYAIEVKFIHPFNARNINMLREVIKDNEKLRLAAFHSNGYVKPINLVFCSSAAKVRLKGHGDPIIKRVREYIINGETGFDTTQKTKSIPEGILNIFIESHFDDNNIKSTSKPIAFCGSNNQWAVDFCKIIGIDLNTKQLNDIK